MSSLYHISSETKARINKFRISTGRAERIEVLPIKIQPKPSYEIVIDEEEREELDELESLDDLAETLPDHAPRFLLMAYPMTTRDGIKKTPLILLYWKPNAIVSQGLKMLYAGALEMVRDVCGTSKLVEVSSGLEDEEDVEELRGQIEGTM